MRRLFASARRFAVRVAREHGVRRRGRRRRTGRASRRRAGSRSSRARAGASFRSASSRRARPSARTSSRAPCSSRARSTSSSPIGASAARRSDAPVTTERVALAARRRARRSPCRASLRAAHVAQSRQLHHQPRRSVPSGSASRRRRSVATCCRASRPPTCLYDERARRRRRDRRHGRRARRHAQAELPAAATSCARRYTVFAEGCRGHLGRRLEARFGLRADVDPQHYGIGFKEIWQIDPAKHRPGEVVHTVGWPLDDATDGGGFALSRRRAAALRRPHRVARVIAIRISTRSPSFSAGRQHPRIRERARRRQANRVRRARREQGRAAVAAASSSCPGGLLVGCEAGFLNPREDQGLAHRDEERACSRPRRFSPRSRSRGDAADAELARYGERVRASWIWTSCMRHATSARVSRSSARCSAARSRSSSRTCSRPRAVTLRNRVAGPCASAREVVCATYCVTRSRTA